MKKLILTAFLSTSFQIYACAPNLELPQNSIEITPKQIVQAGQEVQSSEFSPQKRNNYKLIKACIELTEDKCLEKKIILELKCITYHSTGPSSMSTETVQTKYYDLTPDLNISGKIEKNLKKEMLTELETSGIQFEYKKPLKALLLPTSTLVAGMAMANNSLWLILLPLSFPVDIVLFPISATAYHITYKNRKSGKDKVKQLFRRNIVEKPFEINSMNFADFQKYMGLLTDAIDD